MAPSRTQRDGAIGKWNSLLPFTFYCQAQNQRRPRGSQRRTRRATPRVRMRVALGAFVGITIREVRH